MSKIVETISVVNTLDISTYKEQIFDIHCSRFFDQVSCIPTGFLVFARFYGKQPKRVNALTTTRQVGNFEEELCVRMSTSVNKSFVSISDIVDRQNSPEKRYALEQYGVKRCCCC